MAECPKCGNEIGRSAYCGCGWKRGGKSELGKPIETTVKCCVDTCLISARVKVKTAYGWANFCIQHYDLHYLNLARKTCDEMGLDTPAKQRAWCMAKMPHILRQREPGDDDEAVQPEAEEVPF